MAAQDAVLLLQQAPLGTPTTDVAATTTDPIIPPMRTSDVLDHFYDRLYDLSPESNLSKFLKALLGESGVGGLQKKYTYSHLSQSVSAMRYYELDRFYADVFGVPRLIHERLTFDPAIDPGDSDEWEKINSADSDYRNRVEQFSKAILWAGTPTGIVMAASALLNCDVRVYESFSFLDDAGAYVPPEVATDRTYADIEALGKYGTLESYSYGELETTVPFEGRLDESRGEFIVKPMRNITAEERYMLIKVLGRIKPAEALLTIDLTGTPTAVPVPPTRAYSDSEYWHVRSKVFVSTANQNVYTRYSPTTAVEQPRPASGFYQGEAWNYNGDVSALTAYSEKPDGKPGIKDNYLIVHQGQKKTSYPPANALALPVQIMQGRIVSDGIMAASPVTTGAQA